MTNISLALDAIKNNIKMVNPDGDVLIVGATKTRSIDVVKQAVSAGLVFAGENRVQEFLSKYEPIKGLEWHFIGALQTNKVKYIVDKVSLIHSVDRFDLALEINRQCAKINKVMPVLLEVNIGGEASKSGVQPEKLFELADNILPLPNVSIRGLMTVLPIGADESLYGEMKNLFEVFKQKYTKLPVDFLSMGMSGDYLIALKYGANIIRLGTSLFGERIYDKN